ncbi:Protein of unknown function (DUF3558) [Mycobacterium sp. JS623]|uniref:DUF3558 domain-containing protein n=1 Tax=Mycobacterium sp. JS623 TaxID=212767 RepID=UPI0002A56B6B|nr:DUF3558 domain-containing protein [Mycobacterium sp. JS623]AGB21396.1 Protein of unknown function (DUF3558) [Mycobacterium sp. JS623]
MRWRVNPVAVVAVIAVVAVAGCSQTVSGAARRAQSGAPDPTRSYGYVDDRCGLLVDGSIQQAIGADHIVRPYSGAVCQYVLARGSAIVDVTFSWYETGTLDRERALATERGATITEKVVERHQAYLARRDTTGAACSATAAAGSGVLSWWVQYRNQHNGDPCKDAEKLLTATLQSDM